MASATSFGKTVRISFAYTGALRLSARERLGLIPTGAAGAICVEQVLPRSTYTAVSRAQGTLLGHGTHKTALDFSPSAFCFLGSVFVSGSQKLHWTIVIACCVCGVEAEADRARPSS